MQAKAFTELKPKVVLGVCAHPDDLDFGAGGTMAQWAANGAAVYYLILTDGSKGSADRHISSGDLIAIRQAEQRAAAAAVGAKEVFFLGYQDGCLDCGQDVKRDITRYIRKVKPDVVVTFDPTVVYSAERGVINHTDHRAAGQAALDAVYPLARDHLSYPELLAEGLEPHITPTVLLINFAEGNYTVNISETIQHKLDALAAHASQIPDLDGTHSRVETLAKEHGRHSGHAHAECFVRIDLE